jgi:hypothetical protein
VRSWFSGFFVKKNPQVLKALPAEAPEPVAVIYPITLYHPSCREGKRINNSFEHASLPEGWLDSPAKLPKGMEQA